MPADGPDGPENASSQSVAAGAPPGRLTEALLGVPVRWTITVQPVILFSIRLLAPGYVGVFPALHWRRLLIAAGHPAGVCRILRYLFRRHELIPLIFGAEMLGHGGPGMQRYGGRSALAGRGQSASPSPSSVPPCDAPGDRPLAGPGHGVRRALGHVTGQIAENVLVVGSSDSGPAGQSGPVPLRVTLGRLARPDRQAMARTRLVVLAPAAAG